MASTFKASFMYLSSSLIFSPSTSCPKFWNAFLRLSSVVRKESPVITKQTQWTRVQSRAGCPHLPAIHVTLNLTIKWVAESNQNLVVHVCLLIMNMANTKVRKSTRHNIKVPQSMLVLVLSVLDTPSTLTNTLTFFLFPSLLLYCRSPTSRSSLQHVPP